MNRSSIPRVSVLYHIHLYLIIGPQGLKLQAQASATNLSVVHTRIHTPGLYLSLFSRLNHAKFCVLQVPRPQDLRPGLGDRLGTRLPDLKLSRSSRGFICRVCTSPIRVSAVLFCLSRRVAPLFHDAVRPRPRPISGLKPSAMNASALNRAVHISNPHLILPNTIFIFSAPQTACFLPRSTTTRTRKGFKTRA